MTIQKIGEANKLEIKTACTLLQIIVTFNDKNIPINIVVKHEKGGCSANISTVVDFCNKLLDIGKLDTVLDVLRHRHCSSCSNVSSKLKDDKLKKEFPKSCSDAIYKALITLIEKRVTSEDKHATKKDTKSDQQDQKK